MNDIEKLVAATEREHDKTRAVAKVFVYSAVFTNIVFPFLLIIVLVLMFCFLK
jgi:hypothetical protein